MAGLLALPAVSHAQLATTGFTRQLFGSLGFLSGTSDIAYDPRQDAYLVVGGYERLWGVYVDAGGNLLGPRFSLRPNDNAGHYAETPRIAYSEHADGGAGGFLVTWVHREFQAGGRSLRARVVAYPNRLIGDEGEISAGDLPSSYGVYKPQVAYSPTTRQFLAVWYTFSPFPAASTLSARPIGVDGQPAGAAVSMSSGIAGGLVWQPARNEFGLAYRDGAGARFARLSPAGTVLSDIAVDPPGSLTVQSDPTLAFNPAAGTYLMTWMAYDAAAARDRTYLSVELDARGRRIAAGSLGARDMRDVGLSFDATSLTFILIGYCVPGPRPQEVCGLQLNTHGEAISDVFRITATEDLHSTGEGPPRAAGANSGWLVVFSKAGTYAQGVSTAARDGGPAGPPLSGLCTQPNPFAGLGLGVCRYGAWVRTHADTPLFPSDPTVGGCPTADPFAGTTRGICLNGGWLPVTHPSLGSLPIANIHDPLPPAPTPPQPVTSCAPPDPFVAMGGGVCVDGGWLPRDHPSAQGTVLPPPPPAPVGCVTPDPFVFFGGGLCVNGGWVPRDHPLARGR